MTQAVLVQIARLLGLRAATGQSGKGGKKAQVIIVSRPPGWYDSRQLQVRAAVMPQVCVCACVCV